MQVTWTVYSDYIDTSAQLVAEVRPRWRPVSSSTGATPSAALEHCVRKHIWGTAVSLFERFVVVLEGVEYVGRITELVGSSPGESDVVVHGIWLFYSISAHGSYNR